MDKTFDALMDTEDRAAPSRTQRSRLLSQISGAFQFRVPPDLTGAPANATPNISPDGKKSPSIRFLRSGVVAAFAASLVAVLLVHLTVNAALAGRIAEVSAAAGAQAYAASGSEKAALAAAMATARANRASSGAPVWGADRKSIKTPRIEVWITANEDTLSVSVLPQRGLAPAVASAQLQYRPPTE